MIVRLLFSLFLLSVAHLAAPRPALADDASAARLEASVDGMGWLLSVDFEPPLTSRLEEIVRRGIPLHFTIEFELRRPRWYWWPQQLLSRAMSWRLAYHPLTGDYRLGSESSPPQSFSDLGEALAPIVQLRNWRIELPADLEPGRYQGRVRLRLDSGQLPKPVQIDALTNRDLYPQAEWTRFPVLIPTPTSAR